MLIGKSRRRNASRASPKKSGQGYLFEYSQKKQVSTDYDILQKLGVGAFGFVKKGKSKENGEMVAIKSISKTNVQPGPLIQEVELLKLVQGFDGIVRLIELYETKHRVNIVMELISGGELFDRIVQLEYYKESDAAYLAKQMIDAVAYCHSKNVVHRDLKPENLMFVDNNSNVLKLIDFGVSAVIYNNEPLRDRVGTITYMAPEIIRGEPYGKPSDIYSIGVIIYILLAGYPPFDPENGITELEYPVDDWKEVSPVAIELITRMLEDDQHARPTIVELQNHVWISGEVKSEKQLGTIKSLRNFNTMRKMGASVNAARAKKRVSVFGMFGLQKEKKEMRMQRGSLMLSNDDLENELKRCLTEIRDLFDRCNENIVMLQVRNKEDEAKKRKLIEYRGQLELVAEEYRSYRDCYVKSLR
eukprot:TRINITY_DN8202_c0_g1_i1.p1 TRINITY_DN8202_c0_g1~~TRINITY_DN8202_c0_g1_i1.p1  ORF type:complete len:416 (-),score=97.85 TRINITY_DN8202_c0_g1_i1:48-1295(-)